MNWINKDNNYFLEYDNTLLISVDTDGNYYLYNNKENQKYLVGVQGDSENVVKSNAEEIMKQYNLTAKNTSVLLLAELINTIKSEGSVNSGVYKKLVNSRFLPPTIISQYTIRYINPEDLVKAVGGNEESSMKVLNLYNDIISIDPTTQSVASSTITNKGRNVAIEEAIGFIAKSDKKSLVVVKGEKIFESSEGYASSEEIPLKGFSIKLDDVYSTISVVFLGSCIYVVIVDEINNVDEMFKYDDEVQQYVSDFYGIDLNSYLNTEPINEAFGDGGKDEEDAPIDDTEDASNPTPESKPESTPVISNKKVGADNKNGNSFDFDNIVSEHDEEYVQEIEIIQRNIEKIESLPDDIRYTDDIEEVYLLLLGKKEQIQKLSDDEKSSKIVDKVVSEISTELGDIEGLSNINKDNNDNDLESYIGVNEGKVINFKGRMIKPIVTNKFGVFEKSLIIGKKIHKINESADIRKILESAESDFGDIISQGTGMLSQTYNELKKDETKYKEAIDYVNSFTNIDSDKFDMIKYFGLIQKADKGFK